MIDEDIRTFMIGVLGEDYAAPYMIIEGMVPQEAGPKRIWYRRSSYVNDILLNGPSEITTTDFDIEVVSNDIGEAQEIADELKTALNGYAGEFGDSTCLLAEVQDHDDDYTPQSLGDGDVGSHFATLALSITHR